MTSLFPGMNPYLEQPAFWSSFHTRLLVAIADTLAPELLPKYYIEVETRTYEQNEPDDEVLVGIPDAAVLSTSGSASETETVQVSTQTLPRPQTVTLPMPITVKERYLEVRELSSQAVIAVIEILSPKNKRPGQGRAAYELKRGKVLGSLSHWIEIDLLRSYLPMTILGQFQPTDYRIVVSRSSQRPEADLYGFNLRETIPSFPLPLKLEDEALMVNLQEIVAGVCDRAGYNQRIDYCQPVPPPQLSEADQQWIEDLLSSFRR